MNRPCPIFKPGTAAGFAWTRRLLLLLLSGFLGFLVLATLVSGAAAEDKPLRVFIRAGKKTHGPGEHDYPRFLAEWTRLLTQRGAVADGALNFPDPAQLERADVMILYAPDGGNLAAAERQTLESFTRRGGGLVVLHDGLCGSDPDWFKTIIGGAKQHGVTNWNRAKLELTLTNLDHPVTKGLASFEMDDELFYRLHLMPDLTILATARHQGQAVPQLWCYETKAGAGTVSHRAFVSLQGHYYSTFSTAPYRGILLRGIAWAGRRDPGLLVRPEDLGH